MENKLLDAIFNDNMFLVTEHLGSVSDLDAVLDVGKTALMQAAENENIQIAKVILQHGASIDAAGFGGFTPLQIAVDVAIDGNIQSAGDPGDENMEMIEFLIEHGANLFSKNNDGLTALDIAKQYGSHKVINYLESVEAESTITKGSK